MSIKNNNQLRISKLTLGTVQLGLNYNIPNLPAKPDANESFEILRDALNAGINTFDTARTYGNAEQIIGEFIQRNPAKKINVVTKFKISKNNLHNFEKARTEVYQSLKKSLSVLNLKQIPICLFHKDKDQPMDLVMKILPGILKNLKEDGLIATGGISVYHPNEIKYLLNEEVIKAVQAPMNVFDQRLKESGLLQQLQAQQKIIFIRSIFLKGLFFMPLKNLTGNLTEAGNYLKILHNIADQAGMSVAQLAFSYINDMTAVNSIVFGADNVNQVQQNVGLSQSDKLEDGITKAIEKEFRNLPEIIITPHLWNL